MYHPYFGKNEVELGNTGLRQEHKGFILWFTGLSGSGKSTLSSQLASHFRELNYKVELLDGDEVRTHLSAGLTFSKEDRDTNVARIGWVARLLATHGVIAITAAISPYAAARDEVRELASKKGIPFVEVYLNPQVESLIERDVKGLYKRAIAGEIAHFTGISDPYEPPAHPEIEIITDSESVGESVFKIVHYISSVGLIGLSES